MRNDILAAIDKAPGNVQADLRGSGDRCVALLMEHLPLDEEVELIASAAPRACDLPAASCVLALTARRLIFIAPAPQALSFPLHRLTKVQALSGVSGQLTTFFVEDADGTEYQLGVDGGWGTTFESAAKAAVTAAVIRNG